MNPTLKRAGRIIATIARYAPIVTTISLAGLMVASFHTGTYLYPMGIVYCGVAAAYIAVFCGEADIRARQIKRHEARRARDTP